MIRSKNGSNIFGTKNEWKRTFQEMDHVKIKHFLQDMGAGWLVWIKNILVTLLAYRKNKSNKQGAFYHPYSRLMELV